MSRSTFDSPDLAPQAALAAAGAASIVVHCHLRWDFVWQRPQQIMSRLAAHHAILFLEEPLPGEGPDRLDLTHAAPNVVRAVPRMRDAQGVPTDEQSARILSLLREAIATHPLLAGRFDRPIQWFYSPMTAPAFVGALGEMATVYDCMDELSNFRFAPSDLGQREQFLLSKADVVFTGGYRLYEAKSRHNPNTHFYGCGVDVEHFGKARLSQSSVAGDIARLNGPVLGYFGVIDERLDYELVGALAAAFPGGSVAMVGPVVKVDPAQLPQAPNLHWLGQRDYEALPSVVKGFDVCLMPFALNESTRYINPTKTLEYMAAGKPIVSSAVPDVVRNFAPVVQVAQAPREFVDLVARALDAPDPDRIEQGIAQANDASWDAIIAKIRKDMRDAAAAALLARNLTVQSGLGAVPATRPAEAAAPANPGANVCALRVRRRSLPDKANAQVLVVGAGFSGSVVAERLASHGYSVLVIDKRPHVGGNAYDTRDAHGVLIHPYGPHIFHTNGQYIADYLSGFTSWRPYEHRVRACVKGKLLPMPINIDTVNGLYGTAYDETTIASFFEDVRELRAQIATSEDVVLNSVGRDLYETFFRGYTRKQWGLEPSQLAASVAARIPTRMNRDDRYFTDTFQCMPAEGYTRMFERMLDHPSIRVELGVDFFDVRSRIRPLHVVYTGPIDAYFGHCYGKLPYRSIRFEHEHLALPRYQPVGTVNFPNDHAYTRITEFKHLTGQAHAGTSIVREYPQDEGDPYYPVPRPANEALFKLYEALGNAEAGVTFVGRLAQYRYYNMDQCVGAALKTSKYVMQKLGVAGGTRVAAAPGAASKTVATHALDARESA